LERWIDQHSERDARTLRQVLDSGTTERVIAMLDLYKADMASELALAGTGSGFFVSDQGHVITANHVVSGCEKLRVSHGEEIAPAALVAADESPDLAILQTPIAPLSPATFTINRQARLGEPVMVAGYPLRGFLAKDLNVSTGSVSALAGLRDSAELLQISAPVQPGDSGGPLLDGAGNVMGVVVSKLDAVKVAKVTGDIPQNINFAIKGIVAQSLLDINGISYRTASSEHSVDTADAAARARQFTVVIECWH
jgi:S1-C subfamily serine protease